jgi:hypothetical protein
VKKKIPSSAPDFGARNDKASHCWKQNILGQQVFRLSRCRPGVKRFLLIEKQNGIETRLKLSQS